MRTRRSMALAAAGFAVLPAGAAAYVAPGATIVSASPERQEQADDSSSQVALSGDGRYVVFQTRARNLYADSDPDPQDKFRVGGLFRRDLVSGTLELVANGDLRPESAPETLLVRGAQNASVSADGRFVSFSTGEQLVPADTNGHIDVYVRDMSLAKDQTGAYELISARSGGNVPGAAETPPPETDRPGLNPAFELTGRTAISADGQRVVFRSQNVATDLPAQAGTTTPGQQVFLRDRQTKETRLLTHNQGDPSTPAGGAIGAATISADGSTVLWVGRNAPVQTLLLSGEGSNQALEYYLVQRVADGPGAPTRRITGIVDIDDAGCPSGASIVDNPNATGPCYGPLGQTEGFVGGIVNQVPALSADGRRVLFATIASKRGEQSAGISTDLFLTDTAPSVSRKSATTELTRDGAGDSAINAPIESLALSADGRWALATTFRTTFVLPALRLTSPIRPLASVRELYLIDLSTRTIERVLRGFGGDDTNGSLAGAPAISADGGRIAFLSDASNLFFGDANARADAFVVDRTDTAPPAPPEPEPPAPETVPPPFEDTPPATRPARLSVRVQRGKNGAVRLLIAAPKAGSVTANVRGRIPNADGKLSGAARTLGSAQARATKRRTLTLNVRVSAKLRPTLRRAGKLVGQADVQFEAADGSQYERRLTVAFTAPRPTTKR